MIPASYLSPAQAQSILNTLTQGQGTTQGSNNTYGVLPSLTGGLMTTALTNRILDTDLSTVTTISTAGLTTAEVDALTGIRTRVLAGLALSYADYPKQNPLNDHNTGLPVLQADQDHRVDVIIQTILFWDPRYFLRLRSNVGADALNDVYELPGSYNYLSNPMIISTMRLHGFTSNVANVGPTFSRVTSSTPHGYYSGMTIQDMAVVTATTWTSNVTQNTNTQANIAAVDTFFTSNATPSIVTGNDINVNVPSTANSAYFWSALNNLSSASIEVTGNQLRFYRDTARTDLIRASWGYTVSTGSRAVDTPTERVVVNTDGQHLIVPTAPLQFNYTSGDFNSSIYENKVIDTYNPVTQTFTANVAGFSIYDGQLINMVAVDVAGVFNNPVEDITPQYFDGVNTTQFKLYRTADLAAGNVWAFGNTTTISNIAYSSGNTVWQVNFDSTVAYPALVSGQDIRLVNTTGATQFSAAVSLTQNSAAGNIQIAAGARNFYYSTVGTVSGRDRLVAGGSSGSLVYSDDGQRWNTVATGPTVDIRRIEYNTTLSRFEARTSDTDNRIWTSSTGVTWANTAPFSYSFTPPDLDTWNGRDTFDGYTLIQNASTGEMRIATSAGDYAIGTGVTTTQIIGANSRLATTTNVLCVRINQTVYRVAKSAIGTASSWFATSGINGNPNRISSTLVTCSDATGGTRVLLDGGPGSRGSLTSSLVYTMSSISTPVYLLGFIRGNYIFANAEFSGATEGYYKETYSSGALSNSYDDRYTATAHKFTTGQQIRPSTTFNFNGTIVTPPANLWVEVFDANTIDLFINEERTIGYNSGRPSGVMTASTVTRVFYVKYRSARTWDLYLGSDVTDTANRFTDNTLMTGGTTTGNTVWNGYLTSIADDASTRIRPLFYPQYHSPTQISLHVNAAKTVPYAYFGRNGTLLNQQTNYTTTALYLLTGIAHELVFGADTVLPNIVIGLNTTPLYYAQVANDYVINLYSDAALTVPYTQVTWANSAATLWQVNPAYSGSWRLDEFYVPNIGTKTYFTTNLTTSTTSVNATWGAADQLFYTRFVQDQQIVTSPVVAVAEHAFANAGPYLGQLRFANTTGPGGAGNVLVVSGTIFGGFGSDTPVYYNLNAPGRFNDSSPILFGIQPLPDTGTAPYVDEALAYTGNAWATSSNLTDRELRVWPSTIAPSSMTWTIEQPNSTLESYNLTRYSRARDVTQYRIRLTYPAMTKVQIAEFTNVIHAARGSHKPMLFTPPINNLTQQYVTIKVGDKNTTVPVRFRTRDNIASGEQIVRVEGLPPSLTLADPAFDAGWAVELPIRNSTGSWGIPIHDVLTNAYGEANMRLNNNIASALPYGVAIGADAAELDVFIDADSVELKVDTIGRHYLEIDLVTKRIF